MPTRGYPLTEKQQKRLDAMRGKNKKLYHFFRDGTFSHGQGSVHFSTGTALIFSGHLECVKRNRHHNIWKVK